jgi:hypothetical protein
MSNRGAKYDLRPNVVTYEGIEATASEYFLQGVALAISKGDSGSALRRGRGMRRLRRSVSVLSRPPKQGANSGVMSGLKWRYRASVNRSVSTPPYKLPAPICKTRIKLPRHDDATSIMCPLTRQWLGIAVKPTSIPKGIDLSLRLGRGHPARTAD